MLERFKEEMEVTLNKQREQSGEELRKAVLRMKINDEVVSNLENKIKELLI